MSIFTRYLIELTNYSKRIDKKKARYIDVVRVNALGSKINYAYYNDYIVFEEYSVLVDLHTYLSTTLREAVRRNNAVKIIEHEVRA